VAEGDKLRVRVLRDGRPVAGATVTYDGKVRGTTGEDGGINLRLRHGGLQRIQAGLNEPHEGPQADEVTHTTTLSFELGTP
jgi:nickel transport protein